MTLYFTSNAYTRRGRDAILDALRAAGLDPVPQIDGDLWVMTLRGSGVAIEFQQSDGLPAFAGLEVPMHEDAVGNAVFCVLLGLGWTSEEDVG